MKNLKYVILLYAIIAISCKKNNATKQEPSNKDLQLSGYTIQPNLLLGKYISNNSEMQFTFNQPVLSNSLSQGIEISANNQTLTFSTSLLNNDSTIQILLNNIPSLKTIKIIFNEKLRSKNQQALSTNLTYTFTSGLNSSISSFPTISDDDLLTLVQQQTFKYFWDAAHPISGMALDRIGGGNVVTTGGTGFGLMAILVGMERNFIPQQQGIDRIEKIVTFLKTKTTRYYGAWAHFLNGNTGATIPFSTYDDGADLVETALLMEGLLTVKEYLATKNLLPATQQDIQQLWNEIEWTWFTQGGQNVLYWHWSPNYAWKMNHQITGWNEALIVYVLAASSPTYSITTDVYDKGWARNGAIKNGKKFYDITLPLGEDYGGPLFFAHYSFLGLDPTNLQDKYANYWQQNKAQSNIQYQYSISNPKHYYPYSDNCWGLTASDNNNGYGAQSPTNDIGVISPTAALSSFPYTPEASLKALHFFYYTMGNLLFKEYGFVDAFNLNANWIASSFLAIDQGPIIIMIENYRTQLLWNYFMKNTDVKTGLTKLGFTY